MDSTQISIFKQASHVGLRCLLNGQNCLALESSFGVVASGDLTKDPLEWMLGQNQIGAFLVLSDLSQSMSAWSRSWLLDHGFVLLARWCLHAHDLLGLW